MSLSNIIDNIIDRINSITSGTRSILFDNTASGLTATTVKDAIDEVDSNVDAVESSLTTSQNVTFSGDVSGSSTYTALGGMTVSNMVVGNDVINASKLAVTGNGTTSQYLRSDGDGTFTWATPTGSVYTHPTYNGDDINIDTGPLTGATVISDLDFNVTTDTLGHVTDANAVVATRNLTAANVGALPTSGGTLTGRVTTSDRLQFGTGTATSWEMYNAAGTLQFTYVNTGASFMVIEPSLGVSINSTLTVQTGRNFLIKDGYANLQRSSTASPLFVRQGGSGDIARFFYNTTSGTASGTRQVTINNNADILATGNVTAYSDKKLKTDIENIPDAISKIMQLNGVTFKRVDLGEDAVRQAGVIAQEVQAVLPEVVLEAEDGTLSVAYGNMVGLLIEGIKAQQEELTSQASAIKDLEARLSRLEVGI